MSKVAYTHVISEITFSDITFIRSLLKIFAVIIAKMQKPVLNNYSRGEKMIIPSVDEQTTNNDEQGGE